MGTRNLTVVVHKGEVKMAQYGQWDGYPDGVGLDIAKALTKTTVKALRKHMDNCKFLTADEVKARWAAAGADDSGWVGMDVSKTFKEKNAILSRDTSGGKALDLIIENSGAELFNDVTFARDSLFCEWAYVIDLDEEKVEVYQGFNQKPLTKKDRFFSLQEGMKEKDDMYYPVKLFKSYDFKDFTPEAIGTLTEELNSKAE